MSTPVIFIFIPITLALLLIPLQNKTRLANILAPLFALGFFLTAILLPGDLVIIQADQRIEIVQQMVIFGRSLEIGPENLSMIAFLFLLDFLWNLAGDSMHGGKWFHSLSLIITALWIAVLAVRPFLYAAVIVELIALLSVPLLSPRGEKTEPGVLIYLTFQTMALPLILLIGWLLSGVETAPSASPLILRATLMTLLGFALWVGSFPFHAWLPMLAQKSKTWLFTFLVASMQAAIFVFFLFFLDQYAWLRNFPRLFEYFQVAGAFTIAISGLLAATQKNLSRQFGYLFLAETGYSILAIGLARQGGLSYLAMLFLPRTLSYWLWAWSHSALKQLLPEQELDYLALRGVFKRYPVISIGILVSQLSLVGLPLLPVFPVKLMLWNLSALRDFRLLPWLLVGMVGMLIATLSLGRQLIGEPVSPEPSASPREPLRIIIPIIAACLIFVLIGIFPHWVLPRFISILDPFIAFIPAP